MTVIRAKFQSRSEKRAEMRERIIRESIELFLEQGYDQTTMRQILHKTGILNGSLYNIFKGKDEIYSAVLKDAFIQAMDEAKKILKNDSDVVDRLIFPFILEIYSASESKKIASLLSVGFQKPLVRKDMIDYSVRNLMTLSVVSDHFTESEVRFRTEIGMGALGSVINMYGSEGTDISLQEVVDIVIESLLALFDCRIDDLSERNSNILKLIRDNDIVICGVRI